MAEYGDETVRRTCHLVLLRIGKYHLVTVNGTFSFIVGLINSDNCGYISISNMTVLIADNYIRKIIQTKPKQFYFCFF